MSESQHPAGLRRVLRSRRWLVIPPIVIGLAVIIALAARKKELDRVEATEIASPVRVIKAKHEPITPTATGYGTVQAKRVWVAIAEVGGRVDQTYQPLRSGVFVTKGSLLVKIDPIDYELLQKQRDAELQQARAELRQLELNEQADRKSLLIQQELKAVRAADVERLKKLSGSSAASVSELDAALAAYLTQSQAVQNLDTALSLYESRKLAASAQIASAESRLAEVTRDSQRTEIRAPIDGVLSEVALEVGQYVSPRQLLFKVLEVSTVEIGAQFSLSQIMRLVSPTGSAPEVDVLGKAGGRSQLSARFSARVIVRSGDSTLKYAAVPIRVADQVDPQTRTLGVVVEVANPSFSAEGVAIDSTSIALRPGTFCEVVLESKHRVNGVLLQRTAIDGDGVYVIDDQNRMHRRHVETRKIAGSRIVISSGLMDGDLVVVNPPSVPTEGLLVSPVFGDANDASQDDEAVMLTSDQRSDDVASGQDAKR